MAKRSRILIAEDDDVSRQNLKELLEESGYEAVAYPDGKEAMDAYVTDRFDLILTDLRMPRIDGLELLLYKGINPDALVILITGYGTVNTAVDAMKMGRSTTSPSPSGKIASRFPLTGLCPSIN